MVMTSLLELLVAFSKWYKFVSVLGLVFLLLAAGALFLEDKTSFLRNRLRAPFKFFTVVYISVFIYAVMGILYFITPLKVQQFTLAVWDMIKQVALDYEYKAIKIYKGDSGKVIFNIEGLNEPIVYITGNTPDILFVTVYYPNDKVLVSDVVGLAKKSKLIQEKYLQNSKLLIFTVFAREEMATMSIQYLKPDKYSVVGETNTVSYSDLFGTYDKFPIVVNRDLVVKRITSLDQNATYFLKRIVLFYYIVLILLLLIQGVVQLLVIFLIFKIYEYLLRRIHNTIEFFPQKDIRLYAVGATFLLQGLIFYLPNEFLLLLLLSPLAVLVLLMVRYKTAKLIE